MATFRQRLERGLKTSSKRFLRANAALKRRFGRRGHCLFVTAMPRSASTFLTRSLAELTGFLPFFLGTDHHNEQDLYLPALIDSYTMDVVAHQHTRATERNLAFMGEFGIEPVILVRNLPDALVSLCDHLSREARASPLFAPPAGFRALPYDKRLAITLDMTLPWYVQFYAGWERAAAETGRRILWLSYDELALRPVDAFRRVLEFYRLPAPPEPALRALALHVPARGDVRFNVGRPGRGAEAFTGAQLARIRETLEDCHLMLRAAPHLEMVLPVAGDAAAAGAATPLRRLG
ncbi:MAG TPA: hypothetical protein VMF53_03990 [Alphaproteobacteria bacterium]|nr:hypothetical protein [Alphaproteobacteria bacterium]